MKKTKENNGITMIVLIITIIVLLILAGVSIAMLTRNIGDVEDRKIELTWNELKQASREISNETSIGNQTTEVTIITGNKTEVLRVGDYKLVKYDG